MESRIIARQKEIRILRDCFISDQSDFVAVYGRRRIGKTFLVRELFEDELSFYATGLLNEGTAEQLANFNDELSRRFPAYLKPAANWREAFNNLSKLIEQIPHPGKKVIFLDEVPWMDTKDSGFLAALDHFWNHFASARHDVLLIVCGSATSWMLGNLLNNYGGLHNRLTRQVCLEPFTLSECEQYYSAKNIIYTRYQMVEAYMIFGGVPYYLSLMDSRFSLYQNIDAIYFSPQAPLRNEYPNLINALFAKADQHISILEALARVSNGLNREDLIKQGFADNGRTSNLLADLENNGFVRSYMAYGKKKRGTIYQIIDPFILFHLRFNSRRNTYSQQFWLQFSLTPAYHNWSGLAFERVCLLHIRQLLAGLGISGVLTQVYSWRSSFYEPKAQIDLVIERGDRVINLCEMKFSSEEYVLSKQDDAELRNRRAAFKEEVKPRAALQTTVVTTFGLKQNAYANAITAQLTLDDLFRE